MQCDGCQFWIHHHCTKLTDFQYKLQNEIVNRVLTVFDQNSIPINLSLFSNMTKTDILINKNDMQNSRAHAFKVPNSC